MIVNVKFLNGSSWWREYVLDNSRKVSVILSDPAFITKVRTWPKFDFTGEIPGEIADRLESQTEITIRVGFYKGWPWSKAIASEGGGTVRFNTRKLAYGAGSVGNIAHEIMHAMGFSHDGNSPAGQDNTVPWRVGQWASEWKLPEHMALVSVAVPRGLKTAKVGNTVGARAVV